MMEQLDEFMQHDGDGGDTHAVLQCTNMYTYIRCKKKQSDKQTNEGPF